MNSEKKPLRFLGTVFKLKTINSLTQSNDSCFICNRQSAQSNQLACHEFKMYLALGGLLPTASPQWLRLINSDEETIFCVLPTVC